MADNLVLVSELAALKQQGEPVAWMFKSPLGFKKLQENKPIFGANELPIGWSALYAAPQTCFSAGDMADAQAKAFREGAESNRAAIGELLAALQLAVSIIGHPDDAHSTMIRAAIAKHEPKL